MMRNSTVWEAFEAYGANAILHKHNNPALFSRWHSRLRDMETQILCDSDGDPIPDSNKFEKDGEIWGPMRWPYKAGTEEAIYTDPPMTFLLENHLVAIGSTGWDWKNKKSRWLGYDFDSIAGHAEGVGVSDEQLAQVVERAPEWVEIVRSTRGDGRHLYIMFDDQDSPTTKTHTEHAALARAFLPILSASSGLDLSTSVDVCGSVLWIHHRNATSENRGYALIRPSAKLLTTKDLPPNWQDHLEVVSGKRNKVRVRGWDDDAATDGDELDQMTQAHVATRLDETHHATLDALQATGYTCVWVGDHNLAQTHTGALKQVYDKFAEAGRPLRGLFDTNSRGGDPGKPNCFMRPKPGGAWDVYRFGQGVKEHGLWGKQGPWTHIAFNSPATLVQIVAVAGGVESTDPKLGYQFDSADEIALALDLLGSQVTLPEKALKVGDRRFFLRARQDGKLILTVTKDKSDSVFDFKKWTKKPAGWEILVGEAEECTDDELENESLWTKLDSKARLLKCVSYEDMGSLGGAFDGWVLKDETGQWVRHPRENVISFLKDELDQDFNEKVLGKYINRAWRVVNEPFQPEYPGGRIWNLGASQYTFNPLEMSQGEIPCHPHWDRVMNHCGSDLDQYIPHLEWCKDWGIKIGGDYMKAWTACLLRHPFLKLPYLFMYGPQNSGKSMFHEAIALLVTRGVVKADRALTSSSGYNGELVNAILGVIDEVDINKAGSAVYNKLKEWTTGLTLSVHAKYKQVYEARSSLHFVQMANSRTSCPVMGGDTRITAVYVPPLVEEIPKETLLDKLIAEGPAFMRTMMDWNIPNSIGRLKLPVIETRAKEDIIASNRSLLEAFVQDRCYKTDGAAVALEEFLDAFYGTMDTVERTDWPRGMVRKELSETFPIGRLTSGKDYIGNLTLKADVKPTTKLICDNGKLIREGAQRD